MQKNCLILSDHILHCLNIFLHILFPCVSFTVFMSVHFASEIWCRSQPTDREVSENSYGFIIPIPLFVYCYVALFSYRRLFCTILSRLLSFAFSPIFSLAHSSTIYVKARIAFTFRPQSYSLSVSLFFHLILSPFLFILLLIDVCRSSCRATDKCNAEGNSTD